MSRIWLATKGDPWWCLVSSLTRWWFLTDFFIFTPIPGEMKSNLTSIFFKWVGETTSEIKLWLCWWILVSFRWGDWKNSADGIGLKNRGFDQRSKACWKGQGFLGFVDCFLGFFSDLAKTYSRLERGDFIFRKVKYMEKYNGKYNEQSINISLISNVSVSPCFCFV